MSAATIQLVSPELSHQETILQIVDALDHLDKITEEVFANIQSKIDENAAKLANFDQRVDIADKKVKTLADMSQKATCIYSSAKYPEENQLKDYNSAFFGIENRVKYVKSPVKVKWQEGSNLKRLDARDINEKRRYFHLPVKKKPTTTQVLEDTPDLRNPSKDSTSALSYLIFNTAENPYVKQRSNKNFVNPLNAQNWSKSKKDDNEDNSDGLLGEAPVSFGMDSEVDSTANLFFAPALGDLPDLDLPDDLDLANLPTDLNYMTDLGPGIAPSFKNIPDFSEDFSPKDAEALLSAPPPPPPASAIPPPPTEIAISQIPSLQESLPVLTEIPRLEMPPPPPPMPPPITENLPQKIEDAPDAPSKIPVDDDRAGLMAAIRNAGGSSKFGLQSVKEKKMEEKKAKQEEMDNANSMNKATSSASGGGDLLSDLANKLAMRRKGISGNQNQGAAVSGSGVQDASTMGRMSMMIPALPDQQDDENENQNDDSDDNWD